MFTLRHAIAAICTLADAAFHASFAIIFFCHLIITLMLHDADALPPSIFD